MSSDRDSLRREILAGFLLSRRARLDPEELGIYSTSHRRVPGLRRERYRHPIAGLFTLESTTLVIADAPALRLMLLQPTDDTSADALARLSRASAR